MIDWGFLSHSLSSCQIICGDNKQAATCLLDMSQTCSNGFMSGEQDEKKRFVTFLRREGRYRSADHDVACSYCLQTYNVTSISDSLSGNSGARSWANVLLEKSGIQILAFRGCQPDVCYRETGTLSMAPESHEEQIHKY